MIAEELKSNDLTWLRIYNGVIVQTLAKGYEPPQGLAEDQYMSRKITKGKYQDQNEYYKEYKTLTGLMKPPQVKRGQFGLEIMVFLDSGGTDVCLTLSTKDNAGQAFMRAFRNIRLNEQIKFNGRRYNRKSDGKETTGFWMYQRGNDGTFEAGNSQVNDFHLWDDLPKPIKRYDADKGREVDDYGPAQKFLFDSLVATLTQVYPGWYYDAQSGKGKVVNTNNNQQQNYNQNQQQQQNQQQNYNQQNQQQQNQQQNYNQQQNQQQNYNQQNQQQNQQQQNQQQNYNQQQNQQQQNTQQNQQHSSQISQNQPLMGDPNKQQQYQQNPPPPSQEQYGEQFNQGVPDDLPF